MSLVDGTLREAEMRQAERAKVRGTGDRGKVRGATLLVTFVVVAAVGVGAFVWSNLGSTDTEGVREAARDEAVDPDSGQLRRPDAWPAAEVAVAQATVAYLTGEGVTVVAVVDQAQVVAGGDGSTPEKATCVASSAALDAVGSQDSYRAVAASTPDPVLAELAADAATALAGTLQACTGGGGDTAAEVERLRVVLTYFDMRRNELEGAAQ